MKPKTIVLGTDARGLEPNATVISSLLAHTEGPVWVRIFSRDVPEMRLESGRLTLEVIETPEELRLEARMPAHVNAGGAFDRMAAIRYCTDWDRALVLDYDQLVVGNPGDLFDLDLGENLLAARMFEGFDLREGARQWFGRELPPKWTDCGNYRFFYLGPVMNLAAMRRDGIYDRLLEFQLEAGLEEQIALHVACQDRVLPVPAVFNLVPQWDGLPADARILHFTGPAKPWNHPELRGAPLWRAYETTWEELTCGRWNPQAIGGPGVDRRWEGVARVVAGARRPGQAQRVLEIGGWDFPRMTGLARQWLAREDDRWTMLFRQHVDPAALEEAIRRFVGGLGDRAAMTEILDGNPAEVLSWLLAQDGGWEGFDAVIQHAPQREEDFLTEAFMAWKQLRPGGVMVIHPVRKRPGTVARKAFLRARSVFLEAVADGLGAVKRGYHTLLVKGARAAGDHQASLAAAEERKGVFLTGGFFNRLNNLVTGLLVHGPEFKARWTVNPHMPHRFGDLFEEITGVRVVHVAGFANHPENTDPARGPLCYWCVPRNVNATREEVAASYRHVISRIKVPTRAPGATVGVHFRGWHHSAGADAGKFARWCVDRLRERGVDRCFALADTERDKIVAVLEEAGIGVIQAGAPPMDGDVDRADLAAMKEFIADALALAECETVLISLAETTIADPARAFGRKVLAFSGSRAWSECWFHHRGDIGGPDGLDVLAAMYAGRIPVGLARYGPQRDGGYLVPAALRFDHVITIGVGSCIGFEADYAVSHPDARFDLFDHTLEGLPAPLPLATFHRTGVGCGPGLVPLSDALDECVRDGETVLLKMDCEGAEWACGLEWLNDAGIAAIILEIHGILRDSWLRPGGTVLSSLAERFVLVHAHPNNHTQSARIRSHCLTDCIELTLVNRRIAESLRMDDPPPAPDFDNDPSRPPARLEFSLRESYFSDSSGCSGHSDGVPCLQVSPTVASEPPTALGTPRVLIADVFLAGRAQAGWKEGYELCDAFRNLGIYCDVAGPEGSIPETRIPEIAGDYDLVIITENYPEASGWKWWDWHTVRTPKLFWAIDTHLVDYRPWIRRAGIDSVAFNNPDDMERYGLAGSFFLPYAASAQHHFSVDFPKPLRDAAFIGGMTPERRRLCEKFRIEHLTAYGADYVREMAATKICVNLSISHDLNAKYLEIPASGALMLTNPNEHFRRLLGGGDDVAAMFYRSENELGEKIRYYLAHEAERVVLAVTIRRRIRMFHCWENRVEEILRRMGWNTRVEDAGPAESSPNVIDLRTIPVCLVGGRLGVPAAVQHRYAEDSRYEGLVLSHTMSVPPMPGGHTYGCSAAHLAAVRRALEEHPGQPVLLLEDDAVKTRWFDPLIRDLPRDADVVWLGRSVGFHQGRPSPEYPACQQGKYRRITGACQGTHATLLLTDAGKRVWMECCESAVGGRLGGSTDLVCSIDGSRRSRQYVVALPAFYQPDHAATLYPLD